MACGAVVFTILDVVEAVAEGASSVVTVAEDEDDRADDVNCLLLNVPDNRDDTRVDVLPMTDTNPDATADD